MESGDTKTIFVTMIRGSIIRNFFHTGIITRLLEHGIRVIIVTLNANDREIFKEYEHPNLIFEPLVIQEKRFERLLEEFYKGAAFNKTVHFLYRYRLAGDKDPSRLLYLPRMLFFAPLRFVPGFKRFIRWVDFKINPEQQHEDLFEKYKPDLIFNTASRGDYGILKSAKRRDIQTIDMPKSWDNLSKALFNVKADKLIVWSPFMKRQAVRLQGYKPDEVAVTGVPQFDFYTRKDGLLSREEFCKKLVLDPQKKLLVFSSTGGDMCDEAHYVELIYRFKKEGFLEDIQVLVRPHLGYKGDRERFVRLRKLPLCVIDESDTQRSDKFKDHWDPSLGHVHHLVNTLHHADVLVNLASTMTLDAVACGTEVVNPHFDTKEGVPAHFSTKRLHMTDYAGAVVNSGGTWVVDSEEEYRDALVKILEKGGKKDTTSTAQWLLYKNDGASAERIVSTVVSMLNGAQK